MRTLLQRLRDDQSGVDLIEYALLAAFLSLASVAALNSLGPVVAGFYDKITAFFQGRGL